MPVNTDWAAKNIFDTGGFPGKNEMDTGRH